MLCGNVGNKDALIFTIGERCEWKAPTALSGIKENERKLYLFAND